MDITILSHADGDGICAAALIKTIFPDAYVFFTKPVSLYSDLKDIKSKKIFICDIALTKKHAKDVVELMKRKRAEIFYFDHHVIPEDVGSALEKIKKLNLIHDENKSTSEIVYRYFEKKLPKERIWIAIYGAIADYSDDTKFIIEKLKSWDKRALYFEVSTLVLGIKTDEFGSYDAKREIVAKLAEGKNPSDIRGLVKSAKEAVNREFELYEIVKRNAETFGSVGFVKDIEPFGFRGPLALFAATVTGKKVGLAIHRRKKYFDITMRTRNYNIELNKIAEKAAEHVGGSGGGHPHASGARVPITALREFLKKVDEFVEKN
jgi:RecJ-like exonuclease